MNGRELSSLLQLFPDATVTVEQKGQIDVVDKDGFRRVLYVPSPPLPFRVRHEQVVSEREEGSRPEAIRSLRPPTSRTEEENR